MKTILLSITLIMLATCATKDKAPRPSSHFSSETENEFDLIESEKSKAIDYYKELREKDWKNYKKGKSKFTRIRPRRSKQKVNKIKKEVVLTTEQVEEIYIEIKQNLSYYCMKNRTSSRYSNQADCSAYTQDRLSQCEQKYMNKDLRKVVPCIKRKLGL